MGSAGLIYGAMALGLGATLVLFAVTLVRRPETRPIAARGGLVALAIAAVMSLVVFVAAKLIISTADDALLVAAIVAASYLLLNLDVLGFGLWFKPTANWAVTASLATPVILAAIGFGYSIYRAYPI